MAAGHAHGGVDALYVHGHTALHRMAPEAKVAGAVLFVLAVVTAPREAFAAYAVFVAAILALALVAGVRPASLVRRLAIEVPFLAFAFFLPFVGGGERVEVAGIALRESGLWAAWNILIKATVGVLTSVVLAATTPVADILRGLERLRVPRAFTAIAGFMVRYADVIAGEVQRMRVARLSRCYDPRWIWQARAVATTAGTLFVRSYERGERVYVAMLSRGYRGSLPAVREERATPAEWALALCLPAMAATVTAVAWSVR